MIHFHTAQSLQSILSVFADTLSTYQQRIDAFSSPWIVVQNKETETWLHSEIAKRNGISAHLNFILPNQFVFKLYREIDKDLPDHLPTDRVPLQWAIFNILDTNPEQLSAQGLSIPSSLDSKIALAGEIADVFDLYQIYRPEMLSNWLDSKNSASQSWQSSLWQILHAEIRRLYPEIPFRAEIPNLLLKSIQKGSINLPEEVFIVGISHWNQAFNALITEIAKQSEVHWFQQRAPLSEPLRSVAGDWMQPQVSVKNALIEELARQEVRYSTHPAEIKKPAADSYQHFQVHSCHNPKREVEVLYQQLLKMFDEDASFKANDVLLMVPDLDEYLPHLESVFLDEKAPMKLPIQGAKQAYGQTEDVFLKLLTFFTEGEKVTQFLDVLSAGSIKESFKLSDDFLLYLEQWFEDMHIHFGLLESESNYSIQKGVHQLLEGLLLAEKPFTLYQNHVPYALPLRNDALQLVAQLHAVYRTFRTIKKDVQSDKTITKWVDDALNWCKFLLPENSSVTNTLTKLHAQVSLFESNARFSLDAFRNWVIEHMTSSSASATQFGTGIQISSYIPYRNIPFRITAILGMNEGVFPRNPKRPHFDLIHKKPQAGDRITKLDDQLLFLERISSTIDHIHISFIGEGEQGALVSPLVQQLLDAYPNKRVKNHHLHAFSEFAKSNHEVFESVNTHLFETMANATHHWNKLSDELRHSHEGFVELNDLISFFVDPAKYISTRSLGVSDVFDDELLNDRQLFKLDGLQRYQIRQQVEASIPEHSSDQVRTYLEKSGQLPMGKRAVQTLYTEFEKIETLNAHIARKYPVNARSQSVEITWEGFQLNGTLNGIYNQTLVKSQIASVKGKHIIQLWVEFLVAQIQSEVNSAEIIGLEKDKLVSHRFTKCEHPEDELLKFMHHFGKKSFAISDLCLVPNLSWEFVSSEADDDKLKKKLNELWEGSRYFSGLKDNYYHQLIFGDTNPASFEKFNALCQKFYEPIVKHWVEGEL